MIHSKMSFQQFMGRLVRDPQLKTTSTGKLVMTFTLAYNTYSKTDAAGSTANFLDVEVWEGMADFFAPRLKKGMEILIQGSLKQDRWTDAQGKMRSKFKLITRALTVSDLKRRPDAEYVKEAA